MTDPTARGGQPRARPALAYPTDHLLGVLDDPAEVPKAVAALAAAGLDAPRIRVMAGDDAAAAMGELGRRPGLGFRLVRLVQFTTMDQAPDLRVYEAAAAAGRAVVAVRITDRTSLARARVALGSAGAHFLNYYGRLYTEELSRWRGPELDLPDHLRR